VPIPQPISKTFLFFHFAKSAKVNICDSTKYFLFSTSSKYSLVPISLLECLMLQGLEYQ